MPSSTRRWGYDLNGGVQLYQSRWEPLQGFPDEGTPILLHPQPGNGNQA
jgi:hypothetical protein